MPVADRRVDPAALKRAVLRVDPDALLIQRTISTHLGCAVPISLPIVPDLMPPGIGDVGGDGMNPIEGVEGTGGAGAR